MATPYPLTRRPESVAELDALGRVRLSEHFFMRDMLYSEVANFHGLPNIPDKPELAIDAGTHLCERILEPICKALGPITVRSAYRSPSVNAYCAERLESHGTAYYCLNNEHNRARHIWDMRDSKGFLGATATIVVPRFVSEFERTRDYRPLAWWLVDHVPDFDLALFFPWQCSFNIRWYEGPNSRRVLEDKFDSEDLLTSPSMSNFVGDHSALYPSLAHL